MTRIHLAIKAMSENELSKIIYEEAMYVHSRIGPGMLESAYIHCLVHRLLKRLTNVKTQVPIPLIFEESKLECGYRADIVVNDKVVIEVKSIEAIAKIHKAQLLTYLRFLNLKLGMLLNFNCVHMKDGIKRIVNGL
ncbi:MAG: GxxExxY protein [Flavisolibacter sp.]